MTKQQVRLGTLEELGAIIVEAFRKLPRKKQSQLRKIWYEEMTGKPYRPNRAKFHNEEIR